jgi:hypothetical protein
MAKKEEEKQLRLKQEEESTVFAQLLYDHVRVYREQRTNLPRRHSAMKRSQPVALDGEDTVSQSLKKSEAAYSGRTDWRSQHNS